MQNQSKIIGVAVALVLVVGIILYRSYFSRPDWSAKAEPTAGVTSNTGTTTAGQPQAPVGQSGATTPGGPATLGK